MNLLEPVYFPVTDISSIRQYPVFLLFPKIHLLQPVEHETPAMAEENSDSFIKSGFCQVDTPCPLGENRNRFLHLVNDIRLRTDDYAAQLSSLTLASMATVTDDHEKSEHSIIQQLFTPKNLQKDQLDRQHEAKLWQARLVLAIADILDRESEEIARNLAVLDDSTANLIKELHGDDSFEPDNPFDELRQIESGLGAARTGNISARFNAWHTLLKQTQLKTEQVFVTMGQDAADIIIEKYQAKSSVAPLAAPGPRIPALIGMKGDEAVATVSSFHHQNLSIVDSFNHTLAKWCSADVADEADFAGSFIQVAKQWEGIVEKHFPERKWGRKDVTTYLFPGHNLETIFKEGETASGNMAVVVID
ncbi:hypothetical protein [Desulforhopalus singaporensis]|uniref:Uncharacterized protein n=1 Tax=Desulforhopalus singaporensis TaxID=91360 RepID=A0A1H0TM15_9BACT|nr:hypothetical protein [Desulforhopalus singaporensis]SDP54835.1 hypothetical protein SAMN05660330_03142 [Desulforhopalus singaporensis]